MNLRVSFQSNTMCQHKEKSFLESLDDLLFYLTSVEDNNNNDDNDDMEEEDDMEERRVCYPNNRISPLKIGRGKAETGPPQ